MTINIPYGIWNALYSTKKTFKLAYFYPRGFPQSQDELKALIIAEKLRITLLLESSKQSTVSNEKYTPNNN